VNFIASGFGVGAGWADAIRGSVGPDRCDDRLPQAVRLV
jgi:hypothetical protein